MRRILCAKKAGGGGLCARGGGGVFAGHYGNIPYMAYISNVVTYNL